MLGAVLELEAAMTLSGADTEEAQDTRLARIALRAMIHQLAEPVHRRLIEPECTVRRLAGPLVDLRQQLREQGAYPLADLLRDILATEGVQLRDTGRATQWLYAPEHTNGLS